MRRAPLYVGTGVLFIVCCMLFRCLFAVVRWLLLSCLRFNVCALCCSLLIGVSCLLFVVCWLLLLLVVVVIGRCLLLVVCCLCAWSLCVVRCCSL